MSLHRRTPLLLEPASARALALWLAWAGGNAAPSDEVLATSATAALRFDRWYSQGHGGLALRWRLLRWSLSGIRRRITISGSSWKASDVVRGSLRFTRGAPVDYGVTRVLTRGFHATRVTARGHANANASSRERWRKALCVFVCLKRECATRERNGEERFVFSG